MKKVSMFVLRKMLMLVAAAILTMGLSIVVFGNEDELEFKFTEGPYQIAGSEHAIGNEDTKYTFKPKAYMSFKVTDVESPGTATVASLRKVIASIYVSTGDEVDLDITSVSVGKTSSGVVYGDKENKYYSFTLSADGVALNMYVNNVSITVTEK